MVFLQAFTVVLMLVLPALVGVKYEAVKAIELGKGLVQHVMDLLQTGT